MNDEAFTDYERQILKNVDEHGCHVTYVFDNDDPDFVPFCYSTGFSATVEQGEVITFGLPQEVMHFMINETLEQCRDGLILEDGVAITGLLEGFSVVAKTIPTSRIEREFFNSAMWFHRGEFGAALDVAYQLVWPGAVDGLFPWDDGCAQTVTDLQPSLYRTGTIH